MTEDWHLEDIKCVLNKHSSLIKWNYRNDTILHYGCGSGSVTKLLLPHMPAGVDNVLGVDVNESSIDFAQKYHRHPKVDYRVIEANDDWRLNSTFGHIFSFFSIDGRNNERHLFETFHKHLTRNGDLVLIILNSHGISKIFKELVTNNQKWTSLQPTKSDLIENFDKSNRHIKDVLLEFGFSDMVCENSERYQVFPNLKIFKKFLVSHLGLSHLPDDKIDEFTSDFLISPEGTNSIKYIGKNGSLVAIPYQLTFVYAKKLLRV